MKLTYWVANSLDDHRCYSLRRRTKRELVEALASGDYHPEHFAAPKQVTVEYDNALDLLKQCMCEGSGYWE